MMNYDCRMAARYKSLDEVNAVLAKASSVVKLACGVSNNAAFYLMLDAHDQIKHHPLYKHEAKKAFRGAIDRWKTYEKELINPPSHRFFHLADMGENVRKKYGNITDREYYEFWASMGGEAYQKTKPLVTSLVNKYRLSLIRHKEPHGELTAWVMAAQTGLEIACKVWASAVDECAKEYGLPQKIVRLVFKPFDLEPVRHLWRYAIDQLSVGDYELDETEKRNIGHGLRQLEEAWIHPKTLYGSAVAAVEEYDEVFRTHGEQKKAVRELGEIYSDIMGDL